MPAEQKGPGRWRAGQVRDSGLRAGLILQQSTQSSSGANRMRCADAGHGLSAGAGWEGSGKKAGVWNRIGEIPTSGISGGLGETWPMEAGLRPTAKAVEQPPDPVGARAPRLPDHVVLQAMLEITKSQVTSGHRRGPLVEGLDERIVDSGSVRS